MNNVSADGFFGLALQNVSRAGTIGQRPGITGT